MANQKSFGRRGNLQIPRVSARVDAGAIAPSAKVAFVETPVEQPMPTAPQTDAPSLDQDFHDWKQARRFPIPWRQLSLMASLCFGIASFALPDTVNDNVQWLLYALMAASLYAGFSKRRRKAAG